MEVLFTETRNPGNSWSRFFVGRQHCLQFFCRGIVHCGGGNRERLRKWFISVDVHLNVMSTIFLSCSFLLEKKNKNQKQPKHIIIIIMFRIHAVYSRCKQTCLAFTFTLCLPFITPVEQPHTEILISTTQCFLFFNPLTRKTRRKQPLSNGCFVTLAQNVQVIAFPRVVNMLF